MIACKECGSIFEEVKSLHGHLRKHKLKVKDYYESHYPKVCLMTGKKLPWKDSDDLKSYLARNFINEETMYHYFLDCENQKETKLEKITDNLIKFKDKSELTPTQFELSSSSFSPDILLYSKYFNYTKKCEELGFKTRFNYTFDYHNKLPIDKIPIEEFCINIDTREQNELMFFSTIKGKLSIGDYTLAGKHHNSIYIERKSIGDAGGTFSKIATDGLYLSRFERELLRAREDNKYVIILVECSILDFKKYRFYGFAQSDFILNRMRYISRNFSDCSQIVFAGGRNQCQNLVPAFLLLGSKARNIDLQLWVDINSNNLPRIFSKQDLLKLYDSSL